MFKHIRVYEYVRRIFPQNTLNTLYLYSPHVFITSKQNASHRKKIKPSQCTKPTNTLIASHSLLKNIIQNMMLLMNTSSTAKVSRVTLSFPPPFNSALIGGERDQLWSQGKRNPSCILWTKPDATSWAECGKERAWGLLAHPLSLSCSFWVDSAKCCLPLYPAPPQRYGVISDHKWLFLKHSCIYNYVRNSHLKWN